MNLKGFSNECVAAAIFSIYHNDYHNRFIDNHEIAKKFDCKYEKMIKFIEKVKKIANYDSDLIRYFKYQVPTVEKYWKRIIIISNRINNEEIYSKDLQEFQKTAIQILKDSIKYSFNPMGIVAALIYYNFKNLYKKGIINKKITQKEVANECRVSISTLQKQIKNLKLAI